MIIWNNSTMTTFYPSSAPSSESKCVVKFEGDSILVEYHEDGEFYQYKGSKNGDGHFVLQAEGFEGRATLHMFNESSILEGSWMEEGRNGMWKIELDKS